MRSSQNIALVGPPNSGKTTLFNWLTGRRQKVVNYPGSTVDISVGPLLESLTVGLAEEDSSVPVQIVDTPGTYSLFPKSQDEEVTSRALFSGDFGIEKVILVLDSTQIARQMHLFRQLQEAGFVVVMAVTMHDLHIQESSEVNVRLLSQRLGVPVVAIDGVLGGGVKELAQAALKASAPTGPVRPLVPWSLEKLQEVFREGEKLAREVARKELSIFFRTEVRDKIFLHPLWGGIIFVLVMLTFFSSIYWAAAPLMDLVDAGFGALGGLVREHGGSGLMVDFLSDGIIAGVGAVLVFVPQIFILFVGISLLEDTGYLARAATLIDRPLSYIGLNGKAFVPILSGFACAVPAIMAARSISSAKERWIATFIIPFMTCSARLPVYALLLSFVFIGEPLKAGATLTALYLGGLFIGALAAGLLNKLVKTSTPSYFLLELPIYRRPKLRVILRNSLKRTKSYVAKTGPIILVLAIGLWVLTTFPSYDVEDSSLRLQQSYAAQLGQKLEPLFRPIGADWRVGVGLISAFAAREVFVSALAVMMNITEVDDESTLRNGLIARMHEAQWPNGEPLFTTASVVALLIFFMIALQCISTTAIARQETGSWRFALFQLLSMNILGYAMAAIAYSVIS